METDPEPSSSAPGEARKGIMLVESQCAETIEMGAALPSLEVGSMRTMMEV